MTETILHVQVASGYNVIKILINDFLLDKLADNETQGLIIKLCHHYMIVSELLSDFSVVLQILKPEH